MKPVSEHLTVFVEKKSFTEGGEWGSAAQPFERGLSEYPGGLESPVKDYWMEA